MASDSTSPSIASLKVPPKAGPTLRKLFRFVKEVSPYLRIFGFLAGILVLFIELFVAFCTKGAELAEKNLGVDAEPEPEPPAAGDEE